MRPPRPSPPFLAALVLAGALAPAPARAQDPAEEPAEEAARALLEDALGAEGIRLDLERGLASVPARVLVVGDLLEYLLVGPRGATHESLFVTDATPSLLNAALLALGVEPGENAHWVEVEPATEDRPPVFEARPPSGDGFLLHVAWREADETYLYRVDDLVSNLDTGRSLRRHRWVFLGSRFRAPRAGEPEAFVADLEQNLVNLTFFYQGNTLVTASLPECEEQTIWVANHWILPPRDQPVWLVFARAPLTSLPADWERSLPVVVVPTGDEDAADAR